MARATRSLVDFDDDDDSKPLTAPKRVRVLAPFRVVHDGRAYSDGQIAEVPASVAEQWLLNSWAEEAKKTSRR